MSENSLPDEQSVPSPRARRLWRFRFSLRWYLAGLLVLSLAVSHFLTSRQLGETRQQLVKLRDELGYLTIDDPAMVHAIALETHEPDMWRWRLYFPKGHRYQWRLAYEEIPSRGVPRGGFTAVSNEPYWEKDSEVLVTAKLLRRDDGDWTLSVTSKIGGGGYQMGSVIMPIPAEKARWMSEVSVFDFSLLGDRGTKTLDPAGPIILLMRRPRGKQPGGGPMPGIMVWLEEIDLDT